jgi:hypothetical protein
VTERGVEVPEPRVSQFEFMMGLGDEGLGSGQRVLCRSLTYGRARMCSQ